MNWTDERSAGMICGSAEAERRTYKKIVGTSGRIWLVAVQENEADNIYVAANAEENLGGYKGFRGYGGRTLTFTLEDGSTLELQGPWHSNSAALFADTEYDVRDKYLTFGVIGLDRSYGPGPGLNPVTIKDVLYKDECWTLGTFDRIEILAQHYANLLDKPVVRFTKSKGGTSCGFTKPETSEVQNS